jgi:hypothetical protein
MPPANLLRIVCVNLHRCSNTILSLVMQMQTFCCRHVINVWCLKASRSPHPDPVRIMELVGRVSALTAPVERSISHRSSRLATNFSPWNQDVHVRGHWWSRRPKTCPRARSLGNLRQGLEHVPRSSLKSRALSWYIKSSRFPSPSRKTQSSPTSYIYENRKNIQLNMSDVGVPM